MVRMVDGGASVCARFGGGHPRDAATHFGVGFLLAVRIENVAVVDPSGELKDLDLAQAALTLAAVRHHVHAITFEGLQHGLVGTDNCLYPPAAVSVR